MKRLCDTWLSTPRFFFLEVSEKLFKSEEGKKKVWLILDHLRKIKKLICLIVLFKPLDSPIYLYVDIYASMHIYLRLSVLRVASLPFSFLFCLFIFVWQ